MNKMIHQIFKIMIKIKMKNIMSLQKMKYWLILMVSLHKILIDRPKNTVKSQFKEIIGNMKLTPNKTDKDF